MAIGFYDFDLILAGRRWARTLSAAALFSAALAVHAQYPGQLTKPASKEPTLRAISVLEWTGEEGHPKASRLVPVAVFDGGSLQDGSIYLARPEPLSLAGEVEYELQRNGKPFGLYEIRNSGQEQGSWVGYGAWKAAPPPPKPKTTKPILPLNPSWDDSDDRPVLHRKHHADDPPPTAAPGNSSPAGAQQTQASDPDRPTLHKKPSTDSTAETPAANPAPDPDQPTLHKKTDPNATDSAATPPADPDRPTLHRKPDADSTDTASPTAPAPDPDRPTLHKKADDTASDDAGNAPAPDPDRPTLRKKPAADSAADAGKKKKKQQDVGSVSAVEDATDPDRPRLKRGKSVGATLDVLPSLLGLPPDLHQAVAVSDAHTAAEHPWSFSWADPEDQNKMQAALEQIARDALGLTAPPAPAAPAPAPVTRATSRASSRKPVPAAAEPAEPAPPAPLADEDFRVFELAYGSGATLVLTAHTGGHGAADKYVALIAQPDLYGNVAVLEKNLTDAAHLDDKPRMRLVDAVDAEASNRGDLLFELRGATQRQFALYRVLRGQSERIFATAPADIVTPTQAAPN